MSETLKALKYRNLDAARMAIREAGIEHGKILDDDGAEPAGLLSVVPEDRLDEEDFYRLFGIANGTLVQVERTPYLGYGPPALEEHYMGFVGEGICYVLEGHRLPVEIKRCPHGAQDIHHLEALVLDGQHPLDRARLAGALGLNKEWDFEDLFDLIAEGLTSGEEIDRLLHTGGAGSADR